ncbi:MAG: LemA family protein [Magnetococcales bacterium]|nr:LemA family protein [Magnetococcales bacterium]
MADNPEDHFERLDGLGPETSHSERMRRMKRLLRQLHKDEFDKTRLRLPQIKSKGLIIFLSFASIIIFGITTLYNFNIFITMEERILSARGHIQDALQRRTNLFTNLINLTLNQAALEQEVFRHVADVRAAMAGRQQQGKKEGGATGERPGGGEGGPKSVDTPTGETKPRESGLAATIARLEESPSLAKLMAVVEQYPEVKSSTTYQQLMDKLVELEDRIITRRDTYNDEVRVYNTLITSFPWYILANITGFKRYDYFIADSLSPSDKTVASGSNAAIFHRLLPLAPEENRIRHNDPAALSGTSAQEDAAKAVDNKGKSK